MENLGFELFKVAAGAVVTGIAWIVRSIWHMRRDLDAAFSKIRELEHEVYDDE